MEAAMLFIFLNSKTNNDTGKAQDSKSGCDLTKELVTSSIVEPKQTSFNNQGKSSLRKKVISHTAKQ